MRFKVDENLPAEAAAAFVADGHDALTVLDQQMGGRPDPDVAAICRHEHRALVTLDLDFADIRQYPPGDHFGLIVLRPSRQDKATVLGILARLLPALRTEPLEKHLWIVDDASLRNQRTVDCRVFEIAATLAVPPASPPALAEFPSRGDERSFCTKAM